MEGRKWGREGGSCFLTTAQYNYSKWRGPNFKAKPNHHLPWSRGSIFHELPFYLPTSARVCSGWFVAICFEWQYQSVFYSSSSLMILCWGGPLPGLLAPICPIHIGHWPCWQNDTPCHSAFTNSAIPWVSTMFQILSWVWSFPLLPGPACPTSKARHLTTCLLTPNPIDKLHGGQGASHLPPREDSLIKDLTTRVLDHEEIIPPSQPTGQKQLPKSQGRGEDIWCQLESLFWRGSIRHSSLLPCTSTFITTLEIEANLSLSLQKSKHFSPWVNKKATKHHLSQRTRKHDSPCASASNSSPPKSS